MAFIYLRKKTYWIGYNLNGKLIRRSLKVRDKKVAEHLKNQKEIEIAQGIAHLPSSKNAIDFLNEYETYAKARKLPSTYKREISRLKKFIDFSNARSIKDITTASIQSFITTLSKDGYSSASMNDYRKHIRNLMNYAIAQNYIYENPIKNISKLKETKNPPRFLSQEEIKSLLEKSSGHFLYPMILTALYTGMRVRELINLEWKDIDFTKKIILVQNKANFQTKNKTFRAIPLNSRLIRVLRPLTQKTGYCFGYSGKRYFKPPEKEFKHILARAKIDNCGWHTFRKTFASHLVQKGVSLYKVSKWLGHSDPKLTFSTYAHLAPTTDNSINLITF